MRRVVPLVVPLVLLALVVAAAAIAARGEPKRAITAADQARAKAMLLRKTDLSPAFGASPGGADPDVYCAALDESDLTLTGDAESPNFSLVVDGVPARLVTSGAKLYRTVSDANASWRRGTSAAGEKCARVLLARLVGDTGGRLVSFGRVAFPRLAPKTVAYRIVGSVPQAPVKLYFDVVVLQRGRAQAEILVFTLAQPATRSELVGLARLVAKRQKAAVL